MAEDIIIRYRAEVDELKSQINFLIDQQQELGDAVDNTEKIYNTSAKAGEKATKARLVQIERLETELKRLQTAQKLAFEPAEIRKFDNAIKDTKRDLATLRGETRKVKSENSQLAKSFRNIGGAIAAAFSVQQLIQFTDQATKLAAQFESLRISFDFIEGSAEGGAATFQFLTDLAEELGLELQSTIEAYRSFSGAARLAGVSTAQTQRIFESVSTAVTALGLSAQKADQVFTALSQIISKGVVSAEELRQQLGDALPGAFSLAAQSVGKTEQEFNKLLETGQIISSEFLPNFAEQLRTTFESGAVEGAQSLNAELNRLQNEVTELTLQVGNELAPVWLEFRRFGLEAISDILDRAKQLKNLFQFGLTGDVTGFVELQTEQEKAAEAAEFVAQRLDGLQEEYFNRETKRIERLISLRQKQVADGIISEEQYYKDVDSLRADLADAEQRRNEARIKASQQLALQIQADIQAIQGDLNESGGFEVVTPEERAQVEQLNRQLAALDALLGDIDAEDNPVKDIGPTKEQIDRVKELQKELAKLGDTRLARNDTSDILAQVQEINDQIVKEAEETGNDIFAIRRRVLTEFKAAGDTVLAELLNEQFAFEDLVRSSLNRISESVDGISKELQDPETTSGGLAALADSFRREIDLALQTRDQLISIFASISEARIQELDRQLEAVQRQYEKEQESLETARERRFITQAEFDEREANLQDSVARKEEEIRQKKNEAAKKQAIIEKAAAIFDVALNTAVAISNQLPGLPFTAGLIALIAALGAAQTAAIAAQPIPQFAKGTKGKKDSGMAIVGEEGPEMTFLPKGSKVLPAKQTRTYGEVFDAMYDNRFDDYVLKEFVTPALQEQKRKYEQVQSERFADNVAHSITVSNSGLYWDLENIRKKGQRVVNADDIGRAVAKEVGKVIQSRRRQ